MRARSLRDVLTIGAVAACLALGSGAAIAQSPTVGSQAKTGTAPNAAAPKPTAPETTPKTAATDLLDRTTASKEQLDALKGIGPKRADDIIKGRPYKGKDELFQKKIIPKAVYDGIKDKIIAKQK